MYTQCPDCDTAFPVTARVLQQGAGQVRCGRCGHPFNALERLSEAPPDSRDGRDDPRSVLDALEALAGPDDIRIEDTGVEWRVVDEDDVDAADAGAVEDGTADEDDRSSVSWYIEDADQDAAGNDAAISGAGDEARQHEEGGSEDETSLARRRLQQSLPLPSGNDEDELRYDDNTPLPEDFGQDVESSEPPRRRAEDFIEPRPPEFDEHQVDLALGDPGEWMALLSELGAGEDEPPPEQPAAAGTLEDAQAADLDDTDIRLADGAHDEADADADDEDFPRDIDTQFDLQAVEMGIELTGSRALADGDVGDEVEWVLSDDADAGEPGAADAPGADDALDLRLVEDEPGELELATDTDTREGSARDEPAPPSGHAVARDGNDDGNDVHEQPPEPGSPAAKEPGPAGDAAEQVADDEPAPMTEEELTIARLIDQDLMRFASEPDGLASTTADAHGPRERPHVETIIMEGEVVRTALEDDEAESAAPGKAAGSEADQEPMDTWLASKPPAQAEEQHREPRPWKMIAGAVVLGVLLLVQVVHAYREALATNGAFARAAAPVYRLLGAPLVPNWDARGWQFQATSGGTDANGEVLSISSQIANESDRLLPYPLIYLSLTDRWEEPVGASVLEPGEYLAPDTDTASLVPPGESFTANITIRSLSPDASGFKLNVCYPADAGSLRCAIEDFRK